MASLGTLAVNIVARTDKFTKGITASLGGVNRFRAGVVSAGKAVTAFGLVAGGAAIATMTAGISKAADRIDRLAKTSSKLGIAAERLAELRFAAQQTGVSANTLDTALQRMVRRVAEAAHGTGEAKNALKSLGLSAQGLARLSPDQQFNRIAEALAKVKLQGDRVRLTNKLFDSEGVALVNTLKLGQTGLAAYAAEAKGLGIVLSSQGVKAVEAMNDAVARSQTAVSGLFNKLTVELAPAITSVADAATDWLKRTNQFGKSAIGTFSPVSHAMGIVADVAHTVGLGFDALRIGVMKLGTYAVRSVDAMQKAFVELANTIPGVQIATSSFITSLADTMDAQTKRMQGKLWDKFLDGPPSEGINRMVKKIENQIPKLSIPAKIEVEPAKLPAMVEGILKQAGKAIGSLAPNARKGFAKAIPDFNGQAQSQVMGRATLALARSGSVESYRQRAAIRRQGDNADAEFKRNVKVTAVKATDIADGINTLIGFARDGVGSLLPADLSR